MNNHYKSCDRYTGQNNRYNPFGHNHVALNSAAISAIQYIHVIKIKSQLLLLHALLRNVRIAPLKLVVKYGLEKNKNATKVLRKSEPQTFHVALHALSQVQRHKHMHTVTVLLHLSSRLL